MKSLLVATTALLLFPGCSSSEEEDRLAKQLGELSLKVDTLSTENKQLSNLLKRETAARVAGDSKTQQAPQPAMDPLVSKRIEMLELYSRTIPSKLRALRYLAEWRSSSASVSSKELVVAALPNLEDDLASLIKDENEEVLEAEANLKNSLKAIHELDAVVDKFAKTNGLKGFAESQDE